MEFITGIFTAIWDFMATPLTMYGFTFTLRGMFLFVGVMSIIIGFVKAVFFD